MFRKLVVFLIMAFLIIGCPEGQEEVFGGTVTFTINGEIKLFLQPYQAVFVKALFNLNWIIKNRLN